MKTFIERSYQETVANRQLRRGQTTKQQYDPLEDVTYDLLESVYGGDFACLEDPEAIQLIEELNQLERSCFEVEDIDELSSLIRLQQYSFVKTAYILQLIRVKKLYRKEHGNLKTYCQKALGMSYWTARNYAIAARIWLELASKGFDTLPRNHSQCLAIASILAENEDLSAEDVWFRALDTYEPHRITASRIAKLFPSSMVDTIEEREVFWMIPRKIHEIASSAIALWNGVRDRKVDVFTLIEALLENFYTKLISEKVEISQLDSIWDAIAYRS